MEQRLEDPKAREGHEKMLKITGSRYKLSDGSTLNYIGGDYMLIYPTGEIKLLLTFQLIRQGKKKLVEVDRFMLVDEGLNITHTEWLNNHKEFFHDGKYYVREGYNDNN